MKKGRIKVEAKDNRGRFTLLYDGPSLKAAKKVRDMIYRQQIRLQPIIIIENC